MVEQRGRPLPAVVKVVGHAAQKGIQVDECDRIGNEGADEAEQGCVFVTKARF